MPAFNEERTVGEVVRRIRDLGYEACVIDDGSRDGTASVAHTAGAAVLSLPVNLGVGGALRCGFRYAIASGYRAVVQVDGDGQHNPDDISGLLETMSNTGADMVIGSRFLSATSGYVVERRRRLAMRLLARRASAVVGTPITDATSGFRAIRTPLLTLFAQDYPVEYLGDTFEALVFAGRRGARVAEHPIQAARRAHGTPSAGAVASAWYLVRVLTAASLIQSRTTPVPLDRLAPSPGISGDDRGSGGG